MIWLDLQDLHHMHHFTCLKVEKETFQKTVTKTATTKTSGTQPIYYLCQVTISCFIGQQLDHKYHYSEEKFSISSMDRKWNATNNKNLSFSERIML